MAGKRKIFVASHKVASKVCSMKTECGGKPLTLSSFGIARREKDGLKPVCKACESRYRRDHRLKKGLRRSEDTPERAVQVKEVNVVPAANTEMNELDVRLMVQFNLAIRSNAIGVAESREDFMVRLVAEAPDVIVRAEGHPEIASLVFGVSPEIWPNLRKKCPEIDEAFLEGVALGRIRTLRGHGGVAEQKMEEQFLDLTEEDGPPVSKDPPPEDPDLRAIWIASKLWKKMAISAGDAYELSKCVGVSKAEVEQVIRDSPDLQAEQERITDACVGAVFQNMRDQALDGPYTASVKYVEKRFPEQFGQKQEHTFKGGFAPPPPGPPKSALFTDKPDDDQDD